MNIAARVGKAIVYVTLAVLFLLFLGFASGVFSAFAKAQYVAGRNAYDEGRYRDALNHYTWSERLGMPNERARALVLYRLGDLKGAEALLRRAGDYPNTVVVLGVVVMAQDRDAEAEQIFRSVLTGTHGRTYSSKALAAHNLSVLYSRRGDAKAAKTARAEALKWSKGKSARWSGPLPEYLRPPSP